MPSSSASLQSILSQPHPMVAYRASIDADTSTAPIGSPRGGQTADDDLASFHQLHARSKTWSELVADVMATTEEVLATLNATVADAACVEDGARDSSTGTSLETLLLRLRARNQVAREGSPDYIKTCREAALQRRHMQHPTTPHPPRRAQSPWYCSALQPPPVPSVASVEEYTQSLTAVEKERLMAGCLPSCEPPLHGAAAPPPQRCSAHDTSVTSSHPLDTHTPDQGEAKHSQHSERTTGVHTSVRHPFEVLQEAQERVDRIDESARPDDPVEATWATNHSVGAALTPFKNEDANMFTVAAHEQSFPKPLFDVEWAVPPPVPDAPHGADWRSTSASSSCVLGDDTRETATGPPVITLTPQSDSQEPIGTTDFSVFYNARLRNAHAYALTDTAAVFRAADASSPTAAAEPTVHSSPFSLPADGPAESRATEHTLQSTEKTITHNDSATTHHAPTDTETALTAAATSAYADITSSSPEACLRARVRDVLVAEQTYSEAAREALAVAIEDRHAAATRSASRDRDTIERLQILLIEAQSLLQTVQVAQLHCWREALATAAVNPTQVITSPRFALCCSTCQATFSRTVVRTVCRRCGQYCCPDCVRDLGIGPDVYCPDADGTVHYVSLGWEPICRRCYRHCARYALQMLQQSQPLLLTYHTSTAPSQEADASPRDSTPAISSAVDEQTAEARVRRGAAGRVPLKHLILSGVAGTGGLPSLSHSGGAGVLAADGFPPYYVYVADDRSVSMADRLAYYSVKSTSTWKSALKGTGTLAGNLFARVKKTLGGYRYNPVTTTTTSASPSL